MAEFVVDVVVPAARQTVWQLLDESSSWPTWTPIDSYACERSAGPDGLGEIRVFRNGRHTMREEIVERQPGSHLAYTVLSGLAVRDYRAAIDLSQTGPGSTRVRWRTTFRAKVPGSEWIYRRALLTATAGFVDGLATRAAEMENARPH